MIKKMLMKKCLQPGAKGLAARKALERAWTSYALTRWIPIVGWFIMPILMKMFYPTLDEVEQALKTNQKTD